MDDDLKHLSQRWSMALECAEFGVWDLEPQAHRVHYSPQWKSMLGYPRSDEPDSTAVWRSRVHPDDLAPMVDALTAHLEGRAGTYEHEFRLRAADGGYRWVLSRGRVVARDGDGRALRMIGTLTDITDRRLADSLRAERDVARAAHLAKLEFLSRMSHELRTPLNAVLGFAQLLSACIGQRDVAEQRRFVAHIEKAGWQLLQMIDDVLDLSRAESGQLSLELQPVALRPLLQVRLERHRDQAAQQAVTLSLEMAEGEVWLRADPRRLAQALDHLVDNAIRYNRRGGRVALTVAPAPGGCWRVAVIDTGRGIPAAQMPHLFEPFNRVGRSDSGAEGVGVGLVLTRWLVEHMGGRLAADSREGNGSRFEITLPAAPAPALAAGSTAPAPAAAAADRPASADEAGRPADAVDSTR